MIHAKNLNKSGKKLPGGKGENSLSPADIGLASKKTASFTSAWLLKCRFWMLRFWMLRFWMDG